MYQGVVDIKEYIEIINGKEIKIVVTNNGRPSDEALEDFAKAIIEYAKGEIIKGKSKC